LENDTIHSLGTDPEKLMYRLRGGDGCLSCPFCARFAIMAPTMDYEHPFVAEIRAHPHDDAPRLIYADYLDEAGDPQAELIRVQVALSHLAPGEAERRELELREEELLANYADEWLAPLRELGAEGISARSLQRGLIERVRISADAFLNHGDELCRRAPALHCLELRGVAGMMAKLAARPLPPQVTVLDLSASACRDIADIAALARAAWTAQIAELALSFNRLTDGAVGQLLRGDWQRLTRLNLSVNSLGPESLRLIAQRKPPLTLESLAISVNKIGDLGLQTLGASPLAQSLRELDLGTTGVTAQGVAKLAASPLAATIERLILRGNPLGDGSEDALAALASAPKLKHLDVRGTHRSIPRQTGYGSEARKPPDALCERLGAGLLW
jgi:uncharacterized protein (TIGR02996 family)